jgi:proton-coupled amino acid transporter
MVGICATLAWVGANDLDKFVALVGSFACIPLVYIYPVSLCPPFPQRAFGETD